MFMNILVISIGVFILLVFLTIFYVFFMNLKRNVNKNWLKLYFPLRRRQDMTPALIEIFKKHFPANKKIFIETIKARQKAYFEITDENVAEMNFMIKRIISHGKKSQKMMYDLNFLEMKNTFSENNEAVQIAAVEYNIAVNKYNFWGKVLLQKKVELFDF
ncbi:MAG: hypothetical protein US89_C0012G0017 [Candidatus Peregrinibacteria bacterium GW2011_GWF2_38_29]|nr:MAG: hypothetical protein US89_C0012G0017 [Candidatus Peregrinibacteria bacterium GW2011_GWF2_38_29]